MNSTKLVKNWDYPNYKLDNFNIKLGLSSNKEKFCDLIDFLS